MADDHAIVRKGLRQILAEGELPCEVEEATTGREVLKMIYDADWDILVLDISLPDQSGLDLVKELKHLRPRLPILIQHLSDAHPRENEHELERRHDPVRDRSEPGLTGA